MARQIFIMIYLCLVCFPAFASEESSNEETKKTFPESPLNFAVDLQYYAPAYKTYSYLVDEYGVGRSSSKVGNGMQVAWEWLAFGNKIGKLGIGASSGFVAITDASVEFYRLGVDAPVNRQVNLYVIPSQAFLSYHLDYFYNQIIVPYGKVGASASWIRQTVDGNDSIHMAYGFDYTLGLELCLNAIEPRVGREFDARFGVNASYLIFEYIKSDPLNKTDPVNLAYDSFRAGLRLEF